MKKSVRTYQKSGEKITPPRERGKRLKKVGEKKGLRKRREQKEPIRRKGDKSVDKRPGEVVQSEGSREISEGKER